MDDFEIKTQTFQRTFEKCNTHTFVRTTWECGCAQIILKEQDLI